MCVCAYARVAIHVCVLKSCEKHIFTVIKFIWVNSKLVKAVPWSYPHFRAEEVASRKLQLFLQRQKRAECMFHSFPFILKEITLVNQWVVTNYPDWQVCVRADSPKGTWMNPYLDRGLWAISDLLIYSQRARLPHQGKGAYIHISK